MYLIKLKRMVIWDGDYGAQGKSILFIFSIFDLLIFLAVLRKSSNDCPQV
jgi:hypothetical protein